VLAGRRALPDPGGRGRSVKGKQNLTRKADFEAVYERGRSWVGREIVVRVLPNGLETTRYGFAVSRRVGKAVVRNRVKRRLREIVRQTPLRTGWDIVVIARVAAVPADYASLGKSVMDLLLRAGLLVGEYEGVSPGAN
jgi:ribonuclease P protein component